MAGQAARPRFEVAHANGGSGWLLLSYQIPRKPAAPYMNIYRRLKALRVLPLHGGMAALPDAPWAYAALRETAVQINSIAGASALLLRSEVLDGADELEAVYNDQLDLDYQQIATKCHTLSATHRRTSTSDDLKGRRRLARLTHQLDTVTARDQFGAPGHAIAAGALNDYRTTVLAPPLAESRIRPTHG